MIHPPLDRSQRSTNKSDETEDFDLLYISNFGSSTCRRVNTYLVRHPGRIQSCQCVNYIFTCMFAPVIPTFQYTSSTQKHAPVAQGKESIASHASLSSVDNTNLHPAAPGFTLGDSFQQPPATVDAAPHCPGDPHRPPRPHDGSWTPCFANFRPWSLLLTWMQAPRRASRCQVPLCSGVC